jgi:uncharacterized protein YlbG (UPF0298 family)
MKIWLNDQKSVRQLNRGHQHVAWTNIIQRFYTFYIKITELSEVVIFMKIPKKETTSLHRTYAPYNEKSRKIENQGESSIMIIM